jgi:hypothetical protein
VAVRGSGAVLRPGGGDHAAALAAGARSRPGRNATSAVRDRRIGWPARRLQRMRCAVGKDCQR